MVLQHFSNELTAVLLDICDSWRKLGTMRVTFIEVITSAAYKKGDKKYILNYRPFDF